MTAVPEEPTIVAQVVPGTTFDDFFAAEFRSVAGLAYVLCGRWALAEELAQDAFVSALRRWDQVSTYDDPGAWVRRVVANLATSSWRRRGREARALARFGARPQPDARITLEDPAFWSALRGLPRRQAQCLALRYFEDRSMTDIADVLGISESTVRVHLHAGRRALAARLGELLEEGQS